MKEFNRIKGRMRELGQRQKDTAKLIGISESTFNLKLNGKREFTQSEMNRLCEVLSIVPDKISYYFFTV